jgi:competence protein ComEC
MPVSRFNRFPMLWLAIAFGTGIFAQSILDIAVEVSISVAVVLVGTAVLLRSTASATFLILIATFFAGLGSAKIEKDDVAPDRVKVLYDSGMISSGDPVEIEGILRGRPEASIQGYVLTLAVERLRHRAEEVKASGNVRLFLRSPTDSDLKYGSRIRVLTRLERDDGYLNPGVKPRREILDQMRIDATGSIKSPLLVEKISDESVFVPLAWVYDQRALLIELMRKNLSPSAAGVMIASLLGNREFLAKETADLFRDGGTFHILVISGLHITFIGGILVAILRHFTRRNWFIFWITNLVLWGYTLAVGAEIPVVRAALMFTIMSLAYLIRRDGNLLNSLGISVLILLAWRPSDVFNPSFQLTFVSVASIVAIAFPLLETLRRIGKWTPTPDEPFPPLAPRWLVSLAETLYWNENAWQIELKRQIWKANILKSPLLSSLASSGPRILLRPLFEGVLVSVIVLICMLPLSIVYFHRVAVGSVILNLWVGFFIALESFLVLGAVIFGFASETLAAGWFALAEIANWLMLLLPKLMPVDGWMSFRLAAYTGTGKWIYVLFLLPLIILAIAINSWRPFEIGRTNPWTGKLLITSASLLLGILTLTAVFHPFASSRADGNLRVDFLDVGQGDAALVTFPDGTTMLVDGGGRRRYEDDENADFTPDFHGIGEMVVSPFLWHRGLTRIDFLLATHGDADHTQGLIDVAKNFEVGTAILGRDPLQTDELKEFVAVLDRREVPIDFVAAGDTFRFGDVKAEVLNPTVGSTTDASTNDSSVVLRLTFGERSILLTGDIESAAERGLLALPEKLKADVVKVAHHGSRTSSIQPFVAASEAKIAVIPVGRTSPHGHPHEEVVDRWKSAGAEVLTTGSRGTVTVSTNGNAVLLETYK